MAYVQVDADERLEEGAEGLQFNSFLTAETNPPNVRTPGVDRGYLADAQNGPAAPWSVEYYKPYFDVDTRTVLERCVNTLNPMSAPNYLAQHMQPADLYGPFWTLTTLILTLFLSSSLAASISQYLSGGAEYDYDFGLLSLASIIVYIYGIALPVLLWLALRYLGVGEWSIVEAVSLWGYAQFIWIPVSIVCVIPVPIVRWVLVGLALGLSGYFLGVNIYPILASAEAKATRLIIVLLAVLHLSLALAFKVLFFGYYAVDKIGADIPIPNGDMPVDSHVRM